MLALLSTTFEITNCDFEDMTDIKEVKLNGLKKYNYNNKKDRGRRTGHKL